jgi:hypothetical protein
VRRLVLLEGLGPLTDDEARAPERMREALAAESEGRRRGGPRAGYADAEQVAQRLASAVSMQASSARTLLGRGLVAQDNGRFDWRADGSSLRLPSRLRMTEAQVAAYLGAITAKTLLVRAEPGMPAERGVLQRARREDRRPDVGPAARRSPRPPRRPRRGGRRRRAVPGAVAVTPIARYCAAV